MGNDPAFWLLVIKIGLLAGGGVAFDRRLARRGRTPGYRAASAVFLLYLAAVVEVTLLQFQTLLLLKLFEPGLLLRGLPPEAAFQWIPLVKLTPADLKTSLLNVLMLVPFGFGVPGLFRLARWRAVALGALLSLTIEALQGLTGLLAGTTFRVADVNDLIFNTLGTATGALGAAAAGRWWRKVRRTKADDPAG